MIEKTGNGEMGKVYTRFKPKPHPMGRHMPIWLIKECTPEPQSTRGASPRAFVAGFECHVLIRRCLLTGNSRQSNPVVILKNNIWPRKWLQLDKFERWSRLVWLIRKRFRKDGNRRHLTIFTKWSLTGSGRSRKTSKGRET